MSRWNLTQSIILKEVECINLSKLHLKLMGNSLTCCCRPPLLQYLIHPVLHTILGSSFKLKDAMKIDGSKLMVIKEGNKLELYNGDHRLKTGCLFPCTLSFPVNVWGLTQIFGMCSKLNITRIWSSVVYTSQVTKDKMSFTDCHKCKKYVAWLQKTAWKSL